MKKQEISRPNVTNFKLTRHSTVIRGFIRLFPNSNSASDGVAWRCSGGTIINKIFCTSAPNDFCQLELFGKATSTQLRQDVYKSDEDRDHEY